MSEEAKRSGNWEGSPLQMGSGLDPWGITEIVLQFDTGDNETLKPRIRDRFGSYELSQAATYLDSISSQLDLQSR
ncbi:hypothetical protein GBA65_11630 [Rubrobacter marinus]|uniref:Uncharacterized protein n=1 Tax=Rubrobacter marinus TaxID=2653852 RepID=A0A6G8PXV0_9ACTN|nr:hypothetical protein [Rubrobacter marinus]QIN79064.1 hypothetical protein GBA65_11630 [Rubrobacter marinus]